MQRYPINTSCPEPRIFHWTIYLKDFPYQCIENILILFFKTVKYFVICMDQNPLMIDIWFVSHLLPLQTFMQWIILYTYNFIYVQTYL